jgi:hypothetical protein
MKITRVLLSTILLISVISLIACGGGGGASSSGTVQPVTQPLTISTTTLPTAFEGAAYSQQLQATGGHAPYAWSSIPGAMPQGLTLSSSGVLAGTSTYNGTRTQVGFQATVRDSAGVTAIGVVIVPIVGKIRFANTTIAGGNANIPYTSGVLFPAGGTLPYIITVDSGTLPIGITLSRDGAFSGTPTAPGTFQFALKLADSDTPAQTVTSNFSITIANDLALFPQPELPTGVQNKTYSAQFVAVNGTKPYRFALDGSSTLPPGLTLDATTGTISGTPTTSGGSLVAVRVTDSATPAATAVMVSSLGIAPPLALTNRTALNDGVLNSFYQDSVFVSGGIGPYTVRVSSGALPAGISELQNFTNFQFFGTPTALGTANFTVELTDSETPPGVVTQAYSIRVNTPMVPQIPTALPVGLEGRAYSAPLSVSGGVPPYTWSLAFAPVGLTIDPATGLIGGTPTRAFDGLINVNVHDSSNPPQSASPSPSIHIAGLLHVATSTLPQVVSNSNVNLQLGLRGGTGPFVWSLSSGALPTGLTMSPTGAITGTVTGASSPFTVTVNDQGAPAQTATATLTLPVAAAAGRNDTIATATPLSNGTYFASISPVVDPPGATVSPDMDIYKLTADPGAVVHLETFAQRLTPQSPLDTVIELTDANGARLQTCNTFGPEGAFFSPCMNDDNPNAFGETDSILFFQVPSTATGPVTFYVKVLDFRGDARPDMVYSIAVDGAK